MEFKLPLPCTAEDVERFIHSHCNEHGFPNCQVTSDGSNLIFTYVDLYQHKISPAQESSSVRGPTFWKC